MNQHRYLFYATILFSSFLVLAFLAAKEKDYSPTKSPIDIIIQHKYYTINFDCNRKITNWVYYKLTDKQVTHNADRENDFRKDPLLIKCDVTIQDYNKCGYDRGHLCNAEDMSFDQEAISESFFMSNMTPQLPEFNRGIWKSLETQVRKWVVQYKELYIITGTIIGNSKKKIGIDSLQVPEYCYKALLDNKKKRTLAFIMKNEKSDLGLDKFIISIDSLEKLTHIDMFPQLVDSVENRIEKQKTIW